MQATPEKYQNNVITNATVKPITIEFKDICYKVVQTEKSSKIRCQKQKIEKDILYGLNGIIEPGDLVAIMGSSGAGKSTFLSILSQRITLYSGNILINNVPVEKSSMFKRMSCYIQQNEIFFGDLTVLEHMKNQAGYRLPLSEEERNQRIMDVLEEFNLSKVVDSQIGNVLMKSGRGISGGEKKRLSIATNLLTNPSLIFADEPTSGLDSFLAESVVESLKKLVAAGHTVICTIHQPSADVFNGFNKLILLAEGQIIYFGPRDAAIAYWAQLGHECPPLSDASSFLIETMALTEYSQESRSQQYKAWREIWDSTGLAFINEWNSGLREKYQNILNSKSENIQIPQESKSVNIMSKPFVIPTDENGHDLKVSKSQILKTLFKQDCLVVMRNTRAARARMIQTLFLSVFFGLVFWQQNKAQHYNVAGIMFSVAITNCFPALFSTMTTFIKDSATMTRDLEDGLYSKLTFCVVRMITDIFFFSLFPILFLTICWFMVGIDNRFTIFLAVNGIFYLVYIASSGLGYLIAAISKSFQVAMAVGPTILLPFLTLSGFLIQESSMAVFWKIFYYISPFHYSFSALMRIVYLNQMISMDDNTMTSGNQFLTEFGVATDAKQWYIDIGVLIVWIFGSRMIALILFALFSHKPK